MIVVTWKIASAAVAAILGTVALGYSHTKIRKLEEKMNQSTETLWSIESKIDLSRKEIMNCTPIEVAESVVNRAVEDAAFVAASEEARKAAVLVRNEIRSDVSKRVKDSVAAAQEDCRSQVLDELRRQVGRIDIQDMKKQIRNEAKADVKDKFKGQLDDICNEFNEKLSDVRKIYSSIEKSVTGGDK